MQFDTKLEKILKTNLTLLVHSVQKVAHTFEINFCCKTKERFKKYHKRKREREIREGERDRDQHRL